MWPAASRMCVNQCSLVQRLLRLRERDPIVEEREPVLGRVRVLPAVVAETVAGIEQTAMWKRDRDARREVADTVLAAEPVGDKTDRASQGLFVAKEHAPSGANEADRFRVV